MQITPICMKIKVLTESFPILEEPGRKICFIFIYKDILKKFFNVYFERERERKRERERTQVPVQEGKGGERGREGIPSRLCIVNAESDAGLDSRDREIMT